MDNLATWLGQYSWFTNGDMLALAAFCGLVGLSIGLGWPAIKFVVADKSTKSVP